MSYAQNYTPISNFSQDESNNISGRSTIKNSSVDTEFTNIATTINAINDNLKILQRSDGQLNNFIVTMGSLSNSVKYALGNNPDSAELLDQAVVDATEQAGIATDKAVLTAADRAQTGLDAIATAADAAAAVLARDAALIQAGVYTTEALGRAAVADGQAFKVQGSGEIAAYEYRRTNSTTSVLIATYPSKLAVDTITPKKTTFLQVGKNKFNKAAATTGYYCVNTGVTGANATYDLSDYIPVVAGTQYVCGTVNYSCYFDANYVVVAGGTGTAITTFTPPVGAAYIRVSILHSSINTFQIEIGATATTYESYRYSLLDSASVPIALTLTDGQVTTESMADLAVTPAKIAAEAVTPTKTNFMQIGKNKFNKATATIGYYCVNTGVTGVNATYDLSDYIPVVAGTQYKCGTVNYSCYFDANLNVVAGGTGTAITTFTPPVGAAYIRLTIPHTSLNTFQLEIGATATTYEAYGYTLADPANVPINLTLNDSQVTTAKMADLAVTEDKISNSAVTPAKTNFMQVSKNKFNKAAVTAGYYCTNAGVIGANASLDISEYIPVIAGTAYVCSGTGIRYACYFDASYAVVAGGTSVIATTFTPPVGAVYVRVTMYHNEINTFQLEIGTTSTIFSDYQYVISSADAIPVTATATPVAPALVMPPCIFGVQGRECNLYLDNLHVGDSSLFNHDISNTASNGSQQRERWTWTPTGVQSTGTLTVSAYDKTSGAALISATTNQRAAASTAGTGTTKVINTIGDSLINAATITQTVIDIASTDVMGVSFIGTRGTGANKHEGRGGWKISDYATAGRTFYSFTVSGVVTSPVINSTVYTNNGSTFTVQETDITAGSGTIVCERTAGTNAPSASGTLTKSSGTGDATISFSASSTVSGNPFWIGGALNYPQYLTNNSLATPDWVLISLGINDAFSYTTDATVVAAATAAFANLDLLITSIKAAGAGVKVGLMIPTPPANQDAFAVNYGTGQTAWRDKRNIMLWAKTLIDTYAGQEASRVYLVPTNTALDVANGYPLAASAAVNSRSSVMVQRQNNGVHPDTSGYQQIGDALWAFLKCNA